MGEGGAMKSAEVETYAEGPVWILAGLMSGLRPDAERMLRQFITDAQILWEAPVDHWAGPVATSERWHLSVQVKHPESRANTTADTTAKTGGSATVIATVGRLEPGAAASEEVVHLATWDDESDRVRALRHAQLHVMHQALASVTGRGLAWGILFGVRPGKLAHVAYRQGITEDAAMTRHLQDQYAISSPRANLLTEIARRERAVMPDLYHLDRAVSLYVGIPFCPTHCAYCTFPAYSMVDKARYAEGFLNALTIEIARAGELLRQYNIPVTTVYIGGGTPTSLKAPELRHVLETLLRHVPDAGQWREFSVEAGRADTITADRVAVMRELGVNRVSVNPQSFRASTLRAIGRGHSPEIVDKRFTLFREAGFTNINMDLILGLPGENLDDVLYTLERTLRLHPDAVTVHTLSYKHSSAVTRDPSAYTVADNPTIMAMMAAADRELRAVGQQPYYLYRQKDILANLENVGYSLPGKEGLYNIAIIEEAQTILALGGGGASKWVAPSQGVIGRHQNPREPSVYVGTLDPVWAKKEAVLHSLFSQMQL